MYSGSWFGKENSTTGKAPWQMGAEAPSHQDRTGSREESQPARPGSKQSRHTLNDPLPPPNGPTTSPNSITCWGVHVPTQEPMGGHFTTKLYQPKWKEMGAGRKERWRRRLPSRTSSQGEPKGANEKTPAFLGLLLRSRIRH